MLLRIFEIFQCLMKQLIAIHFMLCFEEFKQSTDVVFSFRVQLERQLTSTINSKWTNKTNTLLIQSSSACRTRPEYQTASPKPDHTHRCNQSPKRRRY